MKKALSVFLAVVIALLVSVNAFALSIDREEYYPIIVVAGYASTSLYVDNGDGTKTHAWGVEIDKILLRVLARIVDLSVGIDKLTKGDAQYVADVVGEEFTEMFDCLRCNPDGSSAYNIKKYCNDAADSNYAYLYEYEDGNYTFEPEIMAMYGEYIGEDWKDYIFNFNTDFRQSAVDCAADLDKYVDSVLEYTGSDKVNLYCVSHGGQVAATYLNLYGKEDADKLNNVLLTVPAIGGAGIAYDFFSGNIDFGEDNLMRFIENGMMFEEDIHWLTAEENLDFLDDVVTDLIPYFNQVMGYWGSMWDFIPADKYEEIRETLDPTESAALLAKSDYYHNTIRPSMWTKLQDCIDEGINVYIIAGYGSNDIAGANVNSDAIIPTESSTGATCAEYGKRFNDGYQALGTQCDNEAHNHVSPDMEVDASTAYLPEQTWYIKGLYHGMTLKSDYGEALITQLMFSDELASIYTYEEFPQFHADSNRCQTVTAYFNNSVEGYVSSADNKLVVENCSKKHELRLISISCDGMDIKFENSFNTVIPVGGKVEIGFTGEIPQTSNALAHVTVNCVSIGAVTPFVSRTLDFTIKNGTSCAFDSENAQISNTLENDGLLNFIISFIPSLAVQKVVIMFYNTTKALLGSLK